VSRDKSRELVYLAIDSERDYQEALWEKAASGGKHSEGEFLLYIEEYVQRARWVCTQKADPEGRVEALKEIRKVAALCVACMEKHGAPQRDLADLNAHAFRRHAIAVERSVDPETEIQEHFVSVLNGEQGYR
jgi:hypothetical protein